MRRVNSSPRSLVFQIGVAVASVLMSFGCSLFGVRSEETPKYQVVEKDGDKEIRRYESYVIATTFVEGEIDDVGGEGFRRLAGYIFGKNESKAQIAMTAPVVLAPKSEKIAMTAPVTLAPLGKGWAMSFMMPSKYKIEDLPKPQDERISFQQVPPRLVACVSYSWLASERKFKQKSDELRAWLSTKPKYQTLSEPIYAGYDPPWTIPFLRKNEVQIEVTESR